eukprot:TRINITY_DN2285_c0_g1_i1.p1 TRINITY_DN2285_c0_g1~~TRINITY_DN2285_c0_g1_i1.p1  ORF type:complete len:225 (+),score=39.95 TRINITY_DN2285_c0_g1_i1:53-676(+)
MYSQSEMFKIMIDGCWNEEVLSRTTSETKIMSTRTRTKSLGRMKTTPVLSEADILAEIRAKVAMSCFNQLADESSRMEETKEILRTTEESLKLSGHEFHSNHFISTLIYMTNYIGNTQRVPKSQMLLLFVTCAMITIKFWDDEDECDLKILSCITGLETSNLKKMERLVLISLDYNLNLESQIMEKRLVEWSQEPKQEVAIASAGAS